MKTNRLPLTPTASGRVARRLATTLSALALLLPLAARADMVGPYTPDTNTLFLLHFDEDAGGSVTTNVGLKGGNLYSVNESAAVQLPPTVTDMLGATGYATNAPAAISFGNCITNPGVPPYLCGYDFNGNGVYDADGGAVSLDRLAMTNLNIGNGGKTPFTLEALIQPISIAGGHQVVASDSSQNTIRGLMLRISVGALQFQYITPAASAVALSATIPTSGPHAFVTNAWYHVAFTYDGTIGKLYWTRLDPSFGAANLLSSAPMVLDATHGAMTVPLDIGGENRGVNNEPFRGCIDEVRISSVARAANEMQFNSPRATITQNPVSQNVDYNQPVTFSVGASSDTPLSYQWRFNSNSIPGVTNSSYVISNVAAANAGYYDVVVTNTIGSSATSSVARLVVGAANFLIHRYSFTNDSSDSIGTATGTNLGNATVTGGALVLDGTAGTYMQLPGDLFNGGNASALSVEFWATFGASGANARVFDFGNTDPYGNAANYVGLTPNGGAGHQIAISGSDTAFQQVIAGAGTLNGRTVHVACVIDPPNKTMSLYTNGVLEAANTNMTVAIGNVNNVYSYIGRSLTATHPYLNASIDELRIYNGALAGLTVRQSEDQGPDTILADGPVHFVKQPAGANAVVGQIVTFSAATVGYLPITYQWFKNGTPVSDATNASWSFTTVMGDHNATIQCWATNVINNTTYTASSSVASLTVFDPPTLAWLDAANGGADSDWNITSLNWTNLAGGAVTAYAPFNRVLFDSRGSGSSTVNLVEPLNPATLTVDAPTDYVLTSSAANGSLTGQGVIIKKNTGKLTLDVTNNLSGNTTISAGTLQIGNGGTAGTTGSGRITNNATLAFNRSDDLNVPNVISGTGSVQVDGSGSVTLSGANSYAGSTLINAGMIRLQNGSGLGAASAGTTVANGGQLYITVNQDVAGEPLALNGTGADGNGALRKGGAGLTTYGGTVTLASDSTIGVDTNATLALAGTPGLIGTGVLTKTGPGTLALSSPSPYSAGIVLAGGILNYKTNGAFGRGNVTSTFDSTGSILLGDGTTLTNSVIADGVNPGAVLGFVMAGNNTNGAVTTVSGPLTFNADALTGGHLAGPTSSGRLDITGPVNLGGSGNFLVVRLGNVRFSGGGAYPEIQVRANTTSLGAHNGIATNAVLDIAGNGSTTVPTYFDLNGFNQTLAGLKNLVTPANVPWVTNSGAAATLTLDLGAGGPFSFGGSIVGNLGLTLNSGTQTLSKNAAALDGLYTYTGDTTINGGTLVLDTGRNLSNSPNITVASGATLDASLSGLTLRATQTLKGNGTVLGNVTGGGVAPGASVGVLTVNGNVLLSGLTTIEVNKTQSTNDQLVVSGALTYGGTLNAVNLGGALNIGDTFAVFTPATASGNFTNVTGSAGSGKKWSFNPTNGVLSVVTGPASTPTNITYSVSGNTLTLTWPQSHLGWMAQSNSVNVASPAAWYDIAGSASVTNLAITINPALPKVFYRLRNP